MTHHAAVYRIVSDVDVPAGAWVQTVPFPVDSAEAERRRHRELTRPGTRTVVLHYPDATELVITAERGPGGRAELDRVVAEKSPEWTDNAIIPLPADDRGPLRLEETTLREAPADVSGTVGHPIPELVRYLPSLDPHVHITHDHTGALIARCWHRPAQQNHVRELLHRLTADPAQIIARGRGDRNDHPRGTIHERVAEQAQRTPDAIAIVDGDNEITYRELVDRAARRAAALDAGPGDLVGVCLDRSANLIITLLAVLMTGAAYVPLDPAHPEARRDLIAQDAGLTQVINSVEQDEAEPEALKGNPDDPAYVIYTSGSTGTPKGVVIPHRNVTALLDGTTKDFGFGPHDTWTWFHSAAFDFSVWEIWGCLLTGGRVVVVPHWTSRTPEDFRDLLRHHRVTVLNQTPSAFSQLLDLESRQPSELDVRLVIFGGEPLDTRPLTRWLDTHPETRLVNMFGITETTVHVTAQTITRKEALDGTKSVGRPIPGWNVRVVDEQRNVVPFGHTGEIAVGGAGLALHYLNRAELTSQRFVEIDGERLYLSGDKGRLNADGTLEHLGRLDNQVQLRGHRIELDEIREVLLTDPAVVAAAVILNQPGDAATARLDAYVVLDGTTANDLKRRAARMLPEYMVPSVTELPALPLTGNGKLDVSQLPQFEEPARQEPEGDDQLAKVLSVWRAQLRTEVTATDNFFDLGGNSLLAARIVRALRDQGIALTVRDVYRNPTPAALVSSGGQP
ncbi:hypothetical protein Lesp02_07140 [Lentzea sp. NBRC 105346]|uniref:non-ribosomal peptide synthetase n=1 Tax=Lentzea sp. NBRC 105346 TaxID=3032205 RepID=UPI0024A36FF0|nr:non-ribosomal peptide synthetase [Lentzea sp. NBRC 105346]GLZ28524.1 hypothetical protein Lesp02_07140 [Lentzea sp. NBRC 105346]